jgi:hypothetical protein
MDKKHYINEIKDTLGAASTDSEIGLDGLFEIYEELDIYIQELMDELVLGKDVNYGDLS